MEWDQDIANLTDAEFPTTAAAVSLMHATVLLRLDPVPVTSYSEIEQDVVGILSNANQTVKTAYELWRRGLLLQTGILLRSAVESSAFAVVLHQQPALHAAYRKRKISSSKAVSQAITILGEAGPNIGQLYGALSSHFVHVGLIQRNPLTWHIDIRKDKLPLQIVLLDLKLTYYLLDVCSEFCLYNRILGHRYWTKDADNLLFKPPVETERSLKRFMEQDIDDLNNAMNEHSLRKPVSKIS